MARSAYRNRLCDKYSGFRDFTPDLGFPLTSNQAPEIEFVWLRTLCSFSRSRIKRSSSCNILVTCDAIRMMHPKLGLDYTGYDFWLTKLKQFNGDYVSAEMVKALLTSIEYRQRFAQ